MSTHPNRREFLAIAGALTGAGLLSATACTAKGSQGGGPPKAVTIKHTFGETVVPTPPKRVVSAGYTEHDDLLAVGVVPIAVTNWFGDQASAVWPWARGKLGSAEPVVLSLDNGIQVDQIAMLKPDLILAVNAGLDSDTYKKLSTIAPTIAQAGSDAFFEPWKEQATAVARAVFQPDQMDTLVSDIDSKFAEAAKNNSQFKDKKVFLLSGNFFHDKLTAARGWRTEFLTQMGFTVSDLAEFAVDDHQAAIPHDKVTDVLGGADILIWTTESDSEQAALLADPVIAGLPATKSNRNVFTTKDLAGAIAFGSPLSYPVVAEQLPPLLSRALG